MKHGPTINLLNPYATLWSWIRETPLHPIAGEDDAEVWTVIRESSDIIDCRHVMVRAALLHALAQHGHPFAFAMGAPWSALTNEQSGRLTAECARRVGANPAKPKGVLPTGVLGPRVRTTHGAAGRWKTTRIVIAGAPPVPESYGGRGAHGWWCGDDLGPETGDDGVTCAERRAADGGAIFIEQSTP